MKVKRYKTAVFVLALLAFIEAMCIAHLLMRPTKAKKAPAPPVPSAQLKPAPKGSIAIVIDDWGYNLNNLAALERIKVPLTAAVLPNLPYSAEISRQLHSRGFEIILHLPMEPRQEQSLEEDTVRTSMDEAQIRRILARDLENLGFAKGVSNHMGSRATEDARTMSAVFRELKDRGLYFFDSLVSARSVCPALARKTGLRFAKRDVFLDNQQDRDYIRGQVEKLKARARLNGKAIGIGHDRRLTLEVLQVLIPQLQKEGYRFVFVSDLAR